MTSPQALIVANPWDQLRQFTAARIALGRTGASLPTQPQLAFQLAHARARDAVHQALDVPQLLDDIESAGLARTADCLMLDSAAGDRFVYLQRPDLGRRLNDASRNRLKARTEQAVGCDIAFVIADGLSARAVAQNAVPLLVEVQRQIAAENWTRAPLVIVRQGRVAIGDEIAELLACKAVVLLIGERPGLSSPDSMGIYLTWMPRVGLLDAGRNCISNVRPAGLSYEDAAFKVHYLLSEMRRRQLSGIMLKEDATRNGTNLLHRPLENFLLRPPA